MLHLFLMIALSLAFHPNSNAKTQSATQCGDIVGGVMVACPTLR